ncbi:MAG TPA: aminotransferase class V-fold PLP-dependent enzyme, partial [Kofleriaceae bacterium]
MRRRASRKNQDNARPGGDHEDRLAVMSTNPRIYLDFNATAPLSPAVRAAITQALGDSGNPSSIHTEGRRARDHVERARDQVARLVGRPREQVVFTSGGTEANALGVLGLAAVAERRGLPRVVASADVDHPSLAGAVAALVGRGWRRRALAVSAAGAVQPIAAAASASVSAAVSAAGAAEGIGLVALAAVNHELGTIAGPEVFASARAAGALIHVDAVQAAGKLDLSAIDADALAISAHKL